MKNKTTQILALGVAGVMMSGLFTAAALMPAPDPSALSSTGYNSQAMGETPVLHARPKPGKRPAGAKAPDFDVVVIDGLDYDLDAVITGTAGVPRLQLASIPEGITEIRAVDRRKEVFFKTLLPLVLQVNEQITAERQRLQEIRTEINLGAKPSAADRLWLAVMTDRYRLKRDDIDGVLGRHDIIPPSLALAQAASESAWGTSRFAREGNALFGQWTFSKNDKGIVPDERDSDKKHRVRAFDSIYDSVVAYADNLNSHRAYREFRKTRAKMRANGGPINGHVLAAALHRYSERGAVYVSELQSIIESNALKALDNARLENSEPQV